MVDHVETSYKLLNCPCIPSLKEHISLVSTWPSNFIGILELTIVLYRDHNLDHALMYLSFKVTTLNVANIRPPPPHPQRGH